MSDRFPVPQEAINYLKRKSVVETDAWGELKWGEHAHAFTVAHSQGAGVLNDLFGCMNDAMESGESYKSFKKKVRALMEEKGWYGREDMGPEDKGYSNWRTRLMYSVNMGTAFEAGRYRTHLRNATMRPIWVYQSKLVGDNRREDHKALHDKAFRYDDPFWNTHHPRNGWGCACTVTTLSEAGAQHEGTEILSSDEQGNPPHMLDGNGSPINWNTFTPDEWRYNQGVEALAPNFNKYKALAEKTMSDGQSVLSQVMDCYRHDMDSTRLTVGELNTIMNRINEPEYTPNHILYQIGNMDSERYDALREAGIDDSKIMVLDDDLMQQIDVPESYRDDFYNSLQRPEKIYENGNPDNPIAGREIHIVHSSHDGTVIESILRQKINSTALRVNHAGLGEDHAGDDRYTRLW